MAVIISIINNKGGTGKTTTSLNLGAALVKKKKRVLLIDLDGQGNLSSSFGLSNTEQHVGDLLLGNCSIEDIIHYNKKLALIPSSPKLLDYEYQINNEPGREYLLKETINSIKDDYDYILVDCAPSLGTLSINSLVAAKHFIVPMQAENFAFIGLDKILNISEKVKKRMNPDINLAGILLIKHSGRTKFSQAIISSIENNESLRKKLFKTTIRQDINLMESAAFHQNIFDYAPKSRGAQDYLSFAKEIINSYGKK